MEVISMEMEMSDAVSERLAFVRHFIAANEADQAFQASLTLINTPGARRFARVWLARAQAALLVEDVAVIDSAWKEIVKCDDFDYAVSSEIAVVLARACFRRGEVDQALGHIDRAVFSSPVRDPDSYAGLFELRDEILRSDGRQDS